MTPDLSQVASLPAGVYIIDKVTASSAEISGERGIQPGERFFVIGGNALAPKDVGLPGAPPGTVTRFAISDGVNPTNLDNVDPSKPRGFSTGQTIEQQFVAPGSANQPAAFNQYNAFRPEETFVQGAARGDTHLLVISDQSARNPAGLAAARAYRTTRGDWHPVLARTFHLLGSAYEELWDFDSAAYYTHLINH